MNWTLILTSPTYAKASVVLQGYDCFEGAVAVGKLATQVDESLGDNASTFREFMVLPGPGNEDRRSFRSKVWIDYENGSHVFKRFDSVVCESNA